MKKQGPGWVYFVADESRLLVLLRFAITSHAKVKIGYTSNLLQRSKTHQTGNSRQIWDVVRPVRFSHQSSARKFESLARKVAINDGGMVHGNGPGQEWYWISLLTLVRLKRMHRKMHGRSISIRIWINRMIKAYRMARWLVENILNLLGWAVVAVLWSCLFSSKVLGKFADMAYRPWQPYNQKFLKWLSSRC